MYDGDVLPIRAADGAVSAFGEGVFVGQGADSVRCGGIDAERMVLGEWNYRWRAGR